MARGPRKTIEEKIQAKQEVIDALMVRVESEKKELSKLYEEKKKKELESLNQLIGESGLEPEEVTRLLQEYLAGQEQRTA